MNALQEQFVTEARELIRQATDDLIALERDAAPSDRIDNVFRAFHTLKGSAGVVELPAMSMMLHAAEDLLASIRGGTLGLDAGIVDAALACLDQVLRWVDDFEQAGALPLQAVEDGRAMAERLRSLLHRDDFGQRGRPASISERGGASLPEGLDRLLETARSALASTLRPQPSLLTAICYEPAEGCFYHGDDPLQLMRRIPDLLTFRIEPRERFLPLAEIDPYACNLRLLAISAGDSRAIAGIFRLVPDQVQLIELPRQAPAGAAQREQQGDWSLIATVIEAQRDLLRVPDRTGDFAGCTGAAARVAANALRHGQRPHLADAVAVAGAAALSKRDAGPLLSALEEALGALVDAAPAMAAERRGQPNPATFASMPERMVDRVLRVSEARIDHLVNLAGELVVARNALAYSARQAEQVLGGGEVAHSIQRDSAALDRLVSELHGLVLQLRMVPMARLFDSLPRLVRDLARQLNKNVALVTRGEATEVDKTIMDRLFEPVVHLVRNALDHGAEDPTQRRAAGKSEAATVSIAASRIADRLVVEVTDDGRGIDPALVRRKAREKRVMPPEELAALSDAAVVELIFSAGFSTAPTVSDISGRGVGMDVVRTAVEQIGGRASLESRSGIGTTVRLDLPLTIAMSRIMVVETGGQCFGIAMDAVTETVRVTPEQVCRIKNNNGFVLRERIVPIVSLAQLMKLPVRKSELTAARLLVVIETAGRIAAFEIDAIRDRLDVVLKPMQGLLAGARGYAGTTLLGNGQVLLVLDMKEILP